MIKTGDQLVDEIFKAVEKIPNPASEKISALGRAAAIAQLYAYANEELRESVLGSGSQNALQH
jgi:hypothetical protein